MNYTIINSVAMSYNFSSNGYYGSIVHTYYLYSMDKHEAVFTNNMMHFIIERSH